MSATVEAFPANVIEKSSTSRVVSIDIFRGLTMVVMIFVNDLASVHGLPWWTYHMPGHIDAMTYVDMVFPLFLFIVGMSLPLAIKQRLKKNPSTGALWWHILLRSFSLVVMGLILANTEKGDSAKMGINNFVWGFLGLAGAVLFWSIYPGINERVTLRRILRASGFILMVAMFAIFRRTLRNGGTGWIDPSYPEILGLIGFTYFSVCILYIPTRRWRWAPLIWFIALLTMCSLLIGGHIQILRHIPLYFWPFGTGALPALTMAGVLTSSIFLDDRPLHMHRKKIGTALFLALVMLFAGWFLTPLGISKIRATPTWCLYTIGAGILIFTALYWISDIKGHTKWAFFAHPAGANTLLTYLIPDFYYFGTAAVGFTYFESHFSHGWPGTLRAVLFTMCILAVSALITKRKIRMQL